MFFLIKITKIASKWDRLGLPVIITKNIRRVVYRVSKAAFLPDKECWT